jgi:GlpG protein
MRLIGELDNPSHAEKFSAFLLTEGISVQTDAVGDVIEIWVKDEDQFERAKSELDQFQADADHARYAQAIQQANTITREKEKRRRKIQKKIVNVGAGGVQRRPTLTLVLIGMCILVALTTDFGDKVGTVFRSLEFVCIDNPEASQLKAENDYDKDSLNIRLANIKKGQIWRLITPIFIHHGSMHILFNMIWLFQLGKLIENRYGIVRFGILVLTTAAISNLLQCTVPAAVGGSAPYELSNGTLLSLLGGMSGVVYGLLGFVWMKSIYDRSSGFYLPDSTLFIMLGFMFLCMVPGFTERLLGINVANWAHAVGLVVGMAIGYAPVFMQKYFNK